MGESDFKIEDGVLKEYTGSDSVVNIPESVEYLGFRVFSGLQNLKEVVIPNGIKAIGWWVFENCTGLERVTIPDSVTTICYGAFMGCTRLRKVTIPSSVVTIDSDAFKDTPFLEYYPSDYVILGNNILHKYTGSATNVTIPKGVTSIGDEAFYSLAKLKEVSIPSGVAYIGDGAFSNCTSLERVNIPRSVKYIGQYAFERCGNLEIVVPKTVETIEEDAFTGCKKVTYVN
jgi:hypothetical protein